MTRIACGIILLLAGVTGALASPWAEVGDNQLRADIELLAMAGVIDGVTTQWPLPWTSITHDLRDDSRLMGQPAAVQAAVSRVLARADWENRKGLSQSVTMDLTNNPSVVHGFDSLGRGDGRGAFSVSYNSDDFAGRLSIGAFTQTFRGHGTFMPDESYAAAKLGDEALLYAGWIDHWWGPGWVSALSLSNNARPMPQIGIERLETTASSWPVLNLLGPWQAEFFVGLLDGPRLQKNTLYNALRVTFNPAPGLEVGLARTEELCGQGHPCDPLREYFDLQNDPNHLNQTNDEGDIDIKYSHDIGGMPAQAYLQLMNEDSSPIAHSGTSHLFGAAIFPDIGHENPLRLTLEYASSISTTDILSFGNYIYGFSYTSFQYPDGMRYRGRTIGFSLDDDSQLLSLQGSWRDDDGYFYELSLHHAVIANHHLPENNIVSPVPVIVNMAEAHVKVPWRHITLDLAGRIQDDQPRPARGFAASIEAAVRLYL